MRIRIDRDGIDKGRPDPIMVEYDSGNVEHCSALSLYAEHSGTVARIVYAPDDPLQDGTRLWIDLGPAGIIDIEDDRNEP